MIRWLPTLWLCFVIVRYGNTAFKALRAPFNPGMDIEWAAAWLGCLLLAALSAIFLSARGANRFWLIVATSATAGVLVLSGSWVPASVATVVVVVAAGLGEFLLQRFPLRPAGLLERIVVTVPIGIGVLALAQLGLAIAGMFRSATSWLLLALLLVPAARGLRAIGHMRPEKGIAGSPLLIAPFVFVFFLNLLWAAAPEIQFDATSVHLAVPRIYLDNGGVLDLPYFFHSHFVHLFNMVYGLCLALGGPFVAKFLVLELSVLCAAGVFVLGERLFSSEVGNWAALIFYTTPLVIWLSGTTYIDIAETFFILAALVAFVRWVEDGGPGWIFATAWIVGVAVGTKLHAISILGVLPVAMVIYAWKLKRPVLRGAVAFLIVACFVALPWYALIYGYTGNPVFPFMNAVFQSPLWEPANTSLNAAGFGIGSSLSDLLRLPFWLTWDSIRFGEALPRGGMGFGVLVAFPLALGLLRKNARLVTLVVIAAAVLHFGFWAFSFQYGRYFIPALPLLLVLGCAVALSPAAPRWNRLLLFAGVLTQVPVASLQFWNIPERFPLARAFGMEGSEEFLQRSLVGYGSARFVNSVIRPQERIVSSGLENLRFYLAGPLHTLAETTQGDELRRLAEMTPSAELARAMVESKFVLIVATEADLRNPAPYYSYLQPEFIKRYARELYRGGDSRVFRVCADGCVD